MAERRDARARPLGGLRLDLVLELVDLVVERVDEVEVALGDLVDEAVGEHPGRVVGLDALLARSSTSQAARPSGGVLRTVSSVSCVRTRSISW